MKSSLSAYDLTHVISELQFLVGAKIEKIFQQKESDDFLFSLHVANQGKQFLYTSLPNLLCLSTFKPSFPDTPPHFCSSLRRKITNARITGISQQGFERIVNIDLSTKNGLSKLIIELLPPGNMILINPEDENRILAIRHPKIWNENRKILPNKPYTYPPAQINTKDISQDEFSQILKSSEKESIVKSLAIDFGLGGFYAEEVVSRTDLSKDTLPQNADTQKIYAALKELLSLQTKPIKTDTEIFPIDPKQDTREYTELTSFNEGIASMALANLEKEDEKKQTKQKKDSLSKYDKIIKSQSNQVTGLDKSQIENQKKAELIYNYYTELKTLLAQINILRKEKSWKNIKEQYKENPLIDSIDEHKGLVYVNLDE